MAAVEKVVIAILGGALLAGCAAQSPGTGNAAARHSPASILKSSKPVAGSTVADSVDSLELRFDPPARLDEVTLSGPNGLMPTMVHAVGEVADYSIPLSGLGPGVYTVSWRATAQGEVYRGTFGFTVK
jgi:methionine-rich copper-binding protein CopC